MREGEYYDRMKFNLKVPLEAQLTSYIGELIIVFFNLQRAEAVTSQLC